MIKFFTLYKLVEEGIVIEFLISFIEGDAPSNLPKEVLIGALVFGIIWGILIYMTSGPEDDKNNKNKPKKESA